MGKHEKTLNAILCGKADAGIRFAGIASLLRYLAFEMRTRGDQPIFYRRGINDILNLQPKGAMAKAYQVKQIRDILVKYHLGVDDHE